MGVQDWLGHVVATLVAGVILVGLFVLTRESQTTSIEVTQYRTARIQANDLSAMLQQDLNNMGSNLCVDATGVPGATMGSHSIWPLDPDTAIVVFDTLSAVRQFVFWGQAGRCRPPQQIRYTWQQTGSSVIEGASVPVFQVRRFVSGNLTGLTADTVTKLYFSLLRADGNGITNLEEVRQVSVELRMVSRFGAEDQLGESRWFAGIHPSGMTTKDWASGPS